MMMREPGFMGLAKQRAKREGMLEVPKRYQPDGGGPEEYPAFVNEQEMAMLKKQGGKGFMTPYGVPSFAPDGSDREGRVDDTNTGSKVGGDVTGTGMFTARDRTDDPNTQGIFEDFKRGFRDLTQTKDSQGNYRWNRPSGDGGGDTGGLGNDAGSSGIPNYETGRMGGGGRRGPSMSSVMTPEQIEAKRKADARAKYDSDQQKRKDEIEAGRTGRKRRGYIEGRMVDAEGRTKDDMGVMTDAEGRVEGDEGFDFETAELKGGFDESTAKMDTTDSYEDYKQQAKGITDKFSKDADTLAGYQSGFDQMARDAKTRGDQAGTDYKSAATTGSTKLSSIGDAYEQTGKDMVSAAKTGQEGFESGATDVSTVKDQFGKEGFQKDIRGLSEQALSTDLGSRDAAMLKGQMEESRMASQKGSEEKLRRELAQSGASPAEIAAKVAQFQQSSAASQAQAGRSETLQSTIQGQQMGQSRLGQAAQLKGQEAGMAGKQAGLAVQQAQLRGQGAAMRMQGSQGQQAALQGQGSMAQASAGMNMQGIQGGTQLAMAGADQQAAMRNQAMGAVQAAGGARQQQMAGIDQQGQYTQAQLNDLLAQETQTYNQQQAELTRQANAQANSGGGGGGGGGGLLGGVTRALGISDARLKKNIKLIKKGKGGDPNIYSFNYIWDNNITWSGVMAQDLLKTNNADAVKMTENGFYMVDYGKLGIEMKQLST